MDDKLTWDEIKLRYPDEWVILVDIDVDQSTNITAGRVIEHDRSRRAMHDRLNAIRAAGGEADAILCTRKPSGRIVVLTGSCRVEN